MVYIILVRPIQCRNVDGFRLQHFPRHVIFKLLKAASASSSSVEGLFCETVEEGPEDDDGGAACKCCGVKKDVGFQPGAIRFICSALMSTFDRKSLPMRRSRTRNFDSLFSLCSLDTFCQDLLIFGTLSFDPFMYGRRLSEDVWLERKRVYKLVAHRSQHEWQRTMP